MKHAVRTVAVVILLVVIAAPVFGAIQLPNYAQGGNLSNDLEKTGGAITKVLTGIAVMAGIGGIVVAGIMFATGKGEEGKQKLTYAVIGLILVAVASGIAAMALGN